MVSPSPNPLPRFPFHPLIERLIQPIQIFDVKPDAGVFYSQIQIAVTYLHVKGYRAAVGKFIRVAEQVGQYSVELVFIRTNQAGIRRTVNHEAIAAPGADAGYGIVHHLIQPEGGNIDFDFPISSRE